MFQTEFEKLTSENLLTQLRTITFDPIFDLNFSFDLKIGQWMTSKIER